VAQMGYQKITMEERRELKRGTKNKLYNPITAEANHRRARKRQSPKLKMTDELWEMVKSKLEKRWSPEQT
jgi:IS30 family transposase